MLTLVAQTDSYPSSVVVVEIGEGRVQLVDVHLSRRDVVGDHVGAWSKD